MAVTVYGLMIVFLLAEVAFMFVLQSHRFNGTLASRSWFIRNWEHNSEGYRDREYGEADMKNKRKLFLLGDSFVGGHGISDPETRFGNLLEEKIQVKGKTPYDAGSWRVINMGVGGSDTRDEWKRLQEFSYQPDLLVHVYYPNDIEIDGKRGGLVLQKARSYADIPALVRYFVRRSYLLNYIYWKYPHNSELIDYKGYVRQCYDYEPVWTLHMTHLDKVIDHADSIDVPMVAVVFPFIEMAKESGFATEPVVEHFRSRNIPVLDVRSMILDEDPLDLVANVNDAHANEYLNQMVANSLYALLVREAYISVE